MLAQDSHITKVFTYRVSISFMLNVQFVIKKVKFR